MTIIRSHTTHSIPSRLTYSCSIIYIYIYISVLKILKHVYIMLTSSRKCVSNRVQHGCTLKSCEDLKAVPSKQLSSAHPAWQSICFLLQTALHCHTPHFHSLPIWVSNKLAAYLPAKEVLIRHASTAVNHLKSSDVQESQTVVKSGTISKKMQFNEQNLLRKLVSMNIEISC